MHITSGNEMQKSGSTTLNLIAVIASILNILSFKYSTIQKDWGKEHHVISVFIN